MSDPLPNCVFSVDSDQVSQTLVNEVLTRAGVVVRAFSRGDHALAALEHDTCGCLLLGCVLEDTTGLQFYQRLDPQTSPPVVLLAGAGDVGACIAAFRQGIGGFLEKPVSRDLLLDALREAHANDSARRQRLAESAQQRALVGSLTSEEQQIVTMLLNGMPNKVIARQLDLSVRSVQLRVSRILKKTRVDTIAALVRLTYPVFGDAILQQPGGEARQCANAASRHDREHSHGNGKPGSGDVGTGLGEQAEGQAPSAHNPLGVDGERRQLQ